MVGIVRLAVPKEWVEARQEPWHHSPLLVKVRVDRKNRNKWTDLLTMTCLDTLMESPADTFVRIEEWRLSECGGLILNEVTS